MTHPVSKIETPPETPDCEPDRHVWERSTLYGKHKDNKTDIPDVETPCLVCSMCGRVEILEPKERAS